MAMTITTKLTSVQYTDAVILPIEEPRLVWVTYNTIADDPDDNLLATIKTTVLKFGENDDVSGQPALVQAIWNAVFVSPKPPVA